MELEMQSGNGNETKNAPITGAVFMGSVLCHYTCILLSNGYIAGFLTRYKLILLLVSQSCL